MMSENEAYYEGLGPANALPPVRYILEIKHWWDNVHGNEYSSARVYNLDGDHIASVGYCYASPDVMPHAAQLELYDAGLLGQKDMARLPSDIFMHITACKTTKAIALKHGIDPVVQG